MGYGITRELGVVSRGCCGQAELAGTPLCGSGSLGSGQFPRDSVSLAQDALAPAHLTLETSSPSFQGSPDPPCCLREEKRPETDFGAILAILGPGWGAGDPCVEAFSARSPSTPISGCGPFSSGESHPHHGHLLPVRCTVGEQRSTQRTLLLLPVSILAPYGC